MPVLLDAAQFGAYAYRLRNWWCNWLTPGELEAVAAVVRRAPHRYVDSILDGHHELTGMVRTNGPPFYPVNRNGRVECLPTLVSFLGSRAFVKGKPGVLHIKGMPWQDDADFEEPSPDERERCLGFSTGSTRAPGLSEAARHRLLGQCMDLHVVEAILAIARALNRSKGSPGWAQPVNTMQVQARERDTESVHGYADLYALAAAAEELDGGPSDIWLDDAAMVYMRSGKHAPTAGPEERKRVLATTSGPPLTSMSRKAAHSGCLAC